MNLVDKEYYEWFLRRKKILWVIKMEKKNIYIMGMEHDEDDELGSREPTRGFLKREIPGLQKEAPILIWSGI